MLSASVSVVCGSLIAHVAQPPALQVNVTEDILFGCAWLRGIILYARCLQVQQVQQVQEQEAQQAQQAQRERERQQRGNDEIEQLQRLLPDLYASLCDN